MNKEENGCLKIIAKHVTVLNDEVGNLKTDTTKMKNDIRWIKRVIYYMAGLGTVIAGVLVRSSILS